MNLKNELCVNVFAIMLSYLMKKKGLSITQMAEFCGLPEQSFKEYLEGKSDPKLSTAMLVAYKLHVTVDELCNLDTIKLMAYMRKQYMWDNP